MCSPQAKHLIAETPHAKTHLDVEMSYSTPPRGCSKHDWAEYLAYSEAVEADVRAEVAMADPVKQRYRLISFVSRSKGKGRKRQHWLEVHLVYDKYAKSCTLWSKYPFDVYATEVLPECLADVAAVELKHRIAQCET